MALEKRAASMIKRLQRELKGTRSNLTAKRNRIKAQIASLRAESQKAQAKRAHAKPAKKAAQPTRARARVKTTLAASPGVNKMSRKGYGARKLTQVEGRAEIPKSPKSQARTAQIKRSQAAAGTPTVKGKRPLQRVPRGRPGGSKSLSRMPSRRFRVQK